MMKMGVLESLVLVTGLPLLLCASWTSQWDLREGWFRSLGSHPSLLLLIAMTAVSNLHPAAVVAEITKRGKCMAQTWLQQQDWVLHLLQGSLPKGFNIKCISVCAFLWRKIYLLHCPINSKKIVSSKVPHTQCVLNKYLLNELIDFFKSQSHKWS